MRIHSPAQDASKYRVNLPQDASKYSVNLTQDASKYRVNLPQATGVTENQPYFSLGFFPWKDWLALICCVNDAG